MQRKECPTCGLGISSNYHDWTKTRIRHHGDDRHTLETSKGGPIPLALSPYEWDLVRSALIAAHLSRKERAGAHDERAIELGELASRVPHVSA